MDAADSFPNPNHVNNIEEPAPLYPEIMAEKRRKLSDIPTWWFFLVGFVIFLIITVGYCPYLRKMIFGVEKMVPGPPALHRHNVRALRGPMLEMTNETDPGDLDPCFHFIEGKFFFMDCVDECKKLGSAIASIHTKRDNELIHDQAAVFHLGEPWIGVAKMKDQWGNIDGTAMDFKKWSYGTALYGIDENYRCVYMNIRDGGNGAWTATDCTGEKRHCVCRMTREACQL